MNPLNPPSADQQIKYFHPADFEQLAAKLAGLPECIVEIVFETNHRGNLLRVQVIYSQSGGKK